jgi:hypothetical protein
MIILFEQTTENPLLLAILASARSRSSTEWLQNLVRRMEQIMEANKSR